MFRFEDKKTRNENHYKFKVAYTGVEIIYDIVADDYNKAVETLAKKAPINDKDVTFELARD